MNSEKLSSSEKQATYEQVIAGLQGMGNFRGDADVAEDLGIPVSPDTLASHVASGGAVAAQMSEAAAARRRDRAYYAEEFGQTGPRNLSEEQRDTNRYGAEAVRAAMRAAREQQ